MPGFEGLPLDQMDWKFSHKKHGNLTIRRIAKSKDTKHILFKLALKVGDETKTCSCNLYVCDYDPDAMPVKIEKPHDFTSSVTYSDIDLTTAGFDGKSIIYVIHCCMAKTGVELGVYLFVIHNIVSDALMNVCNNAGMEYGAHDGDMQGKCEGMWHRFKVLASNRGWK